MDLSKRTSPLIGSGSVRPDSTHLSCRIGIGLPPRKRIVEDDYDVCVGTTTPDFLPCSNSDEDQSEVFNMRSSLIPLSRIKNTYDPRHPPAKMINHKRKRLEDKVAQIKNNCGSDNETKNESSDNVSSPEYKTKIIKAARYSNMYSGTCGDTSEVMSLESESPPRTSRSPSGSPCRESSSIYRHASKDVCDSSSTVCDTSKLTPNSEPEKGYSNHLPHRPQPVHPNQNFAIDLRTEKPVSKENSNRLKDELLSTKENYFNISSELQKENKFKSHRDYYAASPKDLVRDYHQNFRDREYSPHEKREQFNKHNDNQYIDSYHDDIKNVHRDKKIDDFEKPAHSETENLKISEDPKVPGDNILHQLLVNQQRILGATPYMNPASSLLPNTPEMLKAWHYQQLYNGYYTQLLQQAAALQKLQTPPDPVLPKVSPDSQVRTNRKKYILKEHKAIEENAGNYVTRKFFEANGVIFFA